MSTKLNDLPTQCVLGVSLPSDPIEGSTNGRSVDLLAGDGPCFLIAPVNALTTPDPIEISVEESADETDWSAVGLDPAPAVSAPFDGVVSGQFTRTKRYVRAVVAAADGTDVRAAVLIGQQKKSV